LVLRLMQRFREYQPLPLEGTAAEVQDQSALESSRFHLLEESAPEHPIHLEGGTDDCVGLRITNREVWLHAIEHGKNRAATQEPDLQRNVLARTRYPAKTATIPERSVGRSCDHDGSRLTPMIGSCASTAAARATGKQRHWDGRAVPAVEAHK